MSFLMFIIVCLVLQLMNIVLSFNPLLTYTVRFHKVKFTPNITVNYTIDQIKDQQLLNGKIKIDTNHFVNQVAATFHRCDKEGNNCEYFQSWMLTDVCTKLQQKNQVWTKWYDSFVPPMRCPITGGYYKMENGTIDLNSFIRWYPDVINYRWIVTQKLMESDIVIGSYSVEATVFGYRKKPKPLLSN